MTSFRVRSCSSLLCLLHWRIFLTRPRARDVTVCVRAAPRRPTNSRRLRRNRVASPSSRIKRLAAAHRSQLPLVPARPRSAPFLEKKVACLLLTTRSFPHPTAFLRQKGLYQLTRTWWTPYVVRWNIRDASIHPPGTCLFGETIPDFSPFFIISYTGFFSIFHIPDFSSFFMEKNPV